MSPAGAERFDTVVVGGGQAGLAMGYELSRLGRQFVILEANPRVGDSWRKRWDSLRLFTPGWYDSLEGMRFPGPRTTAPTKDEFAGYLETYHERLNLPVRTGTRVDRVTGNGNGYTVEAAGQTFHAEQVVVATGAFQNPWTPPYASELNPAINQLHSRDYKNPSQLRPGGVLVVGAGNSGADICIEVARHHPTWLAGRHPGHVPFRIDEAVTRHLVHLVRFVGHHLLHMGTPIGRKVLPKMKQGGDPLVRVNPKDILKAGVQRVPRVTGVSGGLPKLTDGSTLDVTNVIWCTGFRPDYGWIELPVFDGAGSPVHERGIVPGAPGLYFLGLEFQYGATSDLICGVGRDARYIADHMVSRGASAGTRVPAGAGA